MKLIYNFYYVEKFIHNYWKVNRVFISDKKQLVNNFFSLCMFPYPSGKLHVGHIRNYTLGDIVSSYNRLQGLNVLNPIGWDSFGMPAENAAYKNCTSPFLWTFKNILTMKKQLKRLGFSFDWFKEIATSDPNYYKWEQLLFIKLYNSGLVYKKEGFVNWDPVDKTVLANEQVVNGRGWRSNCLVEKIKIEQWYVKISIYADDLLSDLDKLINWPPKVKEMQKNWIGKDFNYSILFLIDKLLLSFNLFFKDIYSLSKLSQITFFKNHFLFTILLKKSFLTVLNPLTNFPIKLVLVDKFNENDYFLEFLTIFERNFVKFIKKNVIDFVFKLFLFFKRKINISKLFRIQDWCISRQRYWGCPIPIIYCNLCGILCEDENNLPVLLPLVDEKNFNTFFLKNSFSFSKVECPKCFSISYRESDTFDTFFESSWYYLRYICPKIFDSSYLNKWLPVNYYIGGIEHATMHLIYARFFHKILKDFNIVESVEPFDTLLTQGMVLMDGLKVSKSKGNIPDQDFLINVYGADALRMFIIFSAPADHSFEWNSNGINGCKKFLDKIWNYSFFIVDFKNDNKNFLENFKFSEDILLLIKKVNILIEDIRNVILKTFSYNLIVSNLMQIFKLISFKDCYDKNIFYLFYCFFKKLLIFLYPICPHISTFIWNYVLFENINIESSKLPVKFFNVYLKNDGIFLKLFIDNKFKKNIYLDELLLIKNVDSLIKLNDISYFLDGRKIKNVIYKEGKLINIIT